MFLYRVVVRKLTTRAQIARRQGDALGNLAKDGGLEEFSDERHDVTLHVAVDSPWLTTVQCAIEMELGHLDAIEGLITSVELLGDCVMWPPADEARGPSRPDEPADRGDPPATDQA
jgi:hypothetical protein